MLDNNDIAILVRVNDLAERYGIEPYEFVATIRSDPVTGDSILCYETPISDNPQREGRYLTMIDSVGVDERSGIVRGTSRQICEALSKALQLAPKRRERA
jgi:hypothetical protein